MWKILTWNIAGLPYWFNIYGNPELRISNIIKKIIKQDCDIILLQEVFTPSLICHIKHAFQGDYYIRSNNNTRDYQLVGSGLLTLFRKSKFLIKKLNFYHFKFLSGEDKLSNKGLQVFSIYSKELKKTIIVVNTHLNNPDAVLSRFKNSTKNTKNQVVSIQKLLAIFKNKKTILGGDLNMEKLKFKKCIRNKIDYICVNNLTIVKKSKKILKCSLSDHALLSCIIKL